MINLKKNIVSNYRADIDGLRALAILSVIVFHFFPNRLSGGFVGVDIFFVISGYLITSNIFRSQDKGTFSLLDFYKKRVNRIFPALLLVLLFLAGGGAYVLLASEYQQLGKHIFSGAAYISNLTLRNESSYFDISTELKPLLHLWSLAIEEQFYFFWPLMLIISFKLKLNRFKVVVAMIFFSFVFCIYKTKNFPLDAFYFPHSRSWELLIGSLISYQQNLEKNYLKSLSIYFNKIFKFANPNSFVNLLSYLGLVLITASAVFFNKSMPFPGWRALIPTLGAALLICAGQDSHINKLFLQNKFIVFIGLISYPLYLWHWPLLSLARIVQAGDVGFFLKVLILIISFFLAWFTYKFVEIPLTKFNSSKRALYLFSVMFLVGCSGYIINLNLGFPSRYPRLEYLNRNLGASGWGSQNLNSQAECLAKYGKNLQYCMISNIDLEPTVVLIGDSNANHFYPGLNQIYKSKNENLLNIGAGACPPLYGIDVTIHEGKLNCPEKTDAFLNFAISNKSIKTIILSLLGEGYLTGHRDLTEYSENFIKLSYQNITKNENKDILETALRATLKKLSTYNKNIVFIISIPMLDFNPASCVESRPWKITKDKLKAPCSMPIAKTAEQLNEYKKIVKTVLMEFPRITLWDAAKEICKDDVCSAFVGNELIYRDDVHLSESGSIFIANRFLGQNN